MRYFLTVDWCSLGRRGVFCDRYGKGYWKDDEPHTEREMREILGPFTPILAPQSLPYTEEDLVRCKWYPLAEYSNEFGYGNCCCRFMYLVPLYWYILRHPDRLGRRIRCVVHIVQGR